MTQAAAEKEMEDDARVLAEKEAAEAAEKKRLEQQAAEAAAAEQGVRPPAPVVNHHTMRADIIGHFKPCMTEIYLHI